MACWLGKAVGGTLGMPFEGVRHEMDHWFYEPVPTEMIPNDDLDLQVLWACALDKMSDDELRVDRAVLGAAFLGSVEFPWDEYGVAIRNWKDGLRPPDTGSHDNWFTRGMGAAIRSEVWACLAPGNPKLAADYAYEDACLDHAGEGIESERLLAAMEAAAFVETDRHKVLEAGLALLPGDSEVRRAVEDTRRWVADGKDWREVRGLILEKYEHTNFTDVVMNLAFTVLGFLAGEGDFGRSICIANNCAMDTDCTAATVGSLLGIMDPDGIPEKWLKPIGRDLVLSPEIKGITPPDTLDGFTDLVLRLRERLGGRPPQPTAPPDVKPPRVPAERGFTDTPWFGEGWQTWRAPQSPREAFPREAERVELAGWYDTLETSDFRGNTLWLRYRFKLDEARRVRVMFNTPGPCHVWIDNERAFGRDGGRMAPSFHRAPENQAATFDWSAGEHELVAAVARPLDPAARCEWVCGVADAKTLQWLVGVAV